MAIGASEHRAPGGLAVYNEDEENLPPLKYEEGPVGESGSTPIDEVRVRTLLLS